MQREEFAVLTGSCEHGVYETELSEAMKFRKSEGDKMHDKAGASTGVRVRTQISSDIAASLAGIPTGESINREAFTEAKPVQKVTSRHPLAAGVAERRANPNRFVRTHHHRPSHTMGVTRSYAELTRKLQRRQQVQRLMGATVVFGLVATLVSIIF